MRSAFFSIKHFSINYRALNYKMPFLEKPNKLVWRYKTLQIIKIMHYKLFLLLSLFFAAGFSSFAGPKLCITMDDPNTYSTPLMSWQERNEKILETLKKHNLQAALFVCGMRVDNDSGKKLIQRWDDDGHLICNHSYSHSYFHSNKISLDDYEKDFLRCDSLIKNYKRYTKLFRYPFLKEGSTKEKRDGFRDFLRSLGYSNGSVTIDASDWYVDSRMIKALKENPDTYKELYKQFYLQHMYQRAVFYNGLAVKLTGREITHTILIHHSLLNALFLDDLINMFIQNGWEIVNASDAFKDSVFTVQPDVLPAGESLIWSMAKETGGYDEILRYPGEDGDYEEAALNEFLAGKKNYEK
jgi:peptidoglycan/xylan/chitin deacetylase (PgdA/CDA1 family)